jgi:Family of unknown function (DUF5906)
MLPIAHNGKVALVVQTPPNTKGVRHLRHIWLDAEDVREQTDAFHSARADCQQANDRGADIFYTCASFAGDLTEYAGRKAANVVAARSLWLDIDTKKWGIDAGSTGFEALFDWVAQCPQVLIPSAVVLSGGGLHIYFTCDRDIPLDVWHDMADRLRNGAGQVFHQAVDGQCTVDRARILRVPGYRNWKYEDAVVEVMWPMNGAAPVEYTVDELQSMTKDWPRTAAALGAPTASQLFPGVARQAEPTMGSAFADVVVDVPASWSRMADAARNGEGCGVLAQAMADNTGVGYDTWCGLLTVIACTDGIEEGIHAISADHPDWGDTQNVETALAKAQSFGGPRRCATFATSNPACSTCQYRDKVSSPVELGRERVKLKPDTATVAARVLTLDEQLNAMATSPATVTAGDVRAAMDQIKAATLPYHDRVAAVSKLGKVSKAAEHAKPDGSAEQEELFGLSYKYLLAQTKTGDKPVAALPTEVRDGLDKRFVHNRKTGRYLDKNSGTWHTAEVLNTDLRSVLTSAVMQTEHGVSTPIAYLAAAKMLDVVDGDDYLPGGARFVVEHGVSADGPVTRRMLNTYTAPGYTPLHPDDWDDDGRAAWARLVEHMHKAFPGDAKYLMQWMAALLQLPLAKVEHMPILVGPQGSGKSYVLKVLAVLLGESNVNKTAQPEQLLELHNKALVSGVQLVGFEELEGEGVEGKKMLGKLKSWLTSTDVSVRTMGVDAQPIAARARYIACSNRPGVLPFQGERRFAVITSPFLGYHPRELVAKGFTREYFNALHADIGELHGQTRPDQIAALAGGLLHMVDLSDFDLKNPPQTDASLQAAQEVQEMGYSQFRADIEQILDDGGAAGDVRLPGIDPDGVVWLDLLREAHAAKHNSDKWNHREVHEMLLGKQFEKFGGTASGQMRVGGSLYRVFVKRGSLAPDGTPWDAAALRVARKVITATTSTPTNPTTNPSKERS